MTSPLRARAIQAASPLLGRCSFPDPGAPVACAVSGGPDSLALLVLAVAAGCDAVAHHVDHGLRDDSDQDAEVVNEVAAGLGVEVVIRRVDVTRGPNLEARARAARLGALPAGAATGHTADDQAETVLLNLLRGAATDGLAGMRAGPRHPILGLRRNETRALCVELGLSPVEDPTNHDPAHLRNRIRHELIPVLCELAGRDVVPVLARQARLLADDSTLLSELAAVLDPTDGRAIASAPAPLARRALREWLRCGYPPDAATVDRVLSVAAGVTLAADVGSGRSVRRSGGRLRLVPAPEAQDSDGPPCGAGTPG
ncbi:MAG TPA: tRNA lysidine(34) synthetase TilS [Acidimicrobiales bacterium]|nr:tRNA lysidine(34) synthetase TilS [Acidimicrobiales bacterium]